MRDVPGLARPWVDSDSWPPAGVLVWNISSPAGELETAVEPGAQAVSISVQRATEIKWADVFMLPG